MRLLKNAFLISTLVTGITGAALADGYEVPLRTVAPRYSWSGFYGGAHLGGTWGSTSATDNNSYNAFGDTWDANTSGFVAGIQLGYNLQAGPVVFGIEGDLGDLGLHGDAATNFPLVGGDTSSRTDADFYTTVRGRLGIAADDWLFYATAGYFGADTRVSIVDTCTTSPPCGFSSIDAPDKSFRSGWTVGGGIEAALGSAWTAKAEYLYYDLGSTTVTGLAAGTGPQFSWDIDTHGNIVRAGMNYRFWPGY